MLVRSLCCAMLLTLSLAAGAQEMTVQADADVRAAGSPFAAVVHHLSYGDGVVVLEKGDTWSRIATAEGEELGWIHGSSLTRRKLTMTSGNAAAVSASSDELALAGKGFNSELEAQLSADEDLSFDAIDAMERFETNHEAIVAFVEAGELVPAP